MSIGRKLATHSRADRVHCVQTLHNACTIRIAIKLSVNLKLHMARLSMPSILTTYSFRLAYVWRTIFSLKWTKWRNEIIMFDCYLSAVKQTKFHVEVTMPAQSNKPPFQTEHSKSPNIPSLLTFNASFTIKELSSSTTEHSKSAELWNRHIITFPSID